MQHAKKMQKLALAVLVTGALALPARAADNQPSQVPAQPPAMMGAPMMGMPGMMGAGPMAGPMGYMPMQPSFAMPMAGGYPVAPPAMMGSGPYGYGPGTMMGYGMMRFGMGPGMIRSLGNAGVIGNEAVQTFLDETRAKRKELHDLMFDYAEILRQPKMDREKRVELENRIQALRQEIYAKAPRYQLWPY